MPDPRKPAVFPRGITGAWQAAVNVSFYQAAAAMNGNARWQEAISENLASASIPGFKKHNLSFDSIQAGVMPQANLDPTMHFTLPRATKTTSFAAGELRSTGSQHRRGHRRRWLLRIAIAQRRDPSRYM